MIRGIFFFAAFAVLLWSGVAPTDRHTWFLEVFPVLIGVPVFFYFQKKYKVTLLLTCLLCVHAMILCVGGKYTYAQVPFGFYLRDLFGMARNNYDRIGHFAQGFVPALIFREWLIRKGLVTKKLFLFLVVTSFCLSFSAIYEFIEWGVALASGSASDAFLGTQGDPWDTQWDMFTAFIASMLSQILLGKWHEKQIQKLKQEHS